MSDDDARVSKLPKWAQALIEEGKKHQRSAAYWMEAAEARAEVLDRLRREYAQERGVPGSDTWIAEELSDGREAVLGLGSGRAIYFSETPERGYGEWTVTFRDGGLDIDVASPDYVIRPARRGSVVRIEFAQSGGSR
jgi:hypothetical protein